MQTIIKPRREKRGALRVFDVIQIDAGRRTCITMLARSLREVSANLLAQSRGAAAAKVAA